MDERHLIEALRTKTAGGYGERIVQAIKNHKGELAGAAIGGLGLGTGQYISNKRRGKRASIQQSIAQKKLDETKATVRQAKKEGRPLTYNEEVDAATAPGVRKLTDVMAKHPVRSSFPAAIIGAAAGLSAARRLARKA